MDSAEDRFIEVGDSVCGEEHDTIAVFQVAEEHRHELVATDIFRRALLQVHVCLVQKNESIPVVGGLKDARELNLHRSWIKAQLAGRDLKSQTRLWDAPQQIYLPNKAAFEDAQTPPPPSRSFRRPGFH